jgi:hypothetical protein
VSPVKYELDFYVPEDDILHSYRRENLKSYNQCEVSVPVFHKRLISKFVFHVATLVIIDSE